MSFLWIVTLIGEIFLAVVTFVALRRPVPTLPWWLSYLAWSLLVLNVIDGIVRQSMGAILSAFVLGIWLLGLRRFRQIEKENSNAERKDE